MDNAGTVDATQSVVAPRDPLSPGEIRSDCPLGKSSKCLMKSNASALGNPWFAREMEAIYCMY